jgi:hypothetical protein
MLSQRVPDHEVSHAAFDPTYHIGIHYPAIATRATDGELAPTRQAKGMSGSALWDTRYKWAESNKVPWKPEMAQICGVLWGAPDETVIATKIEHIREKLAGVLA